MSTRFRKHSTRKTRRSKSLKTRKHRGGNFMNGLFHRKKDSTGDMMGSTGNAHAFLGIKKKGFFGKMKNFFTRKEKQDGGAGPMSISIPSFSGLFGPKSPVSSSSSPPSSPKANTTTKNNKGKGNFQMYMGNVTGNRESKSAFVMGKKFTTYLTTLEQQIKKIKETPQEFMFMKQSLQTQLNQNDKILKQLENKLSPTAISEIKSRLSTIRSLLA